jgi:hypothetical protein
VPAHTAEEKVQASDAPEVVPPVDAAYEQQRVDTLGLTKTAARRLEALQAA